jgi:hypothetical protein
MSINTISSLVRRYKRGNVLGAEKGNKIGIHVLSLSDRDLQHCSRLQPDY